MKNKPLNISIIVPLFNEMEVLPTLFKQLKQFENKDLEVILVDGGSCDGTASTAKLAGFTVISSAKGRAAQMNKGVEKAKGDIFLFLHADTQLPANADDLIKKSIANEKVAWGRFNIRFDNTGIIFIAISFFINWRSSLSGIATGDQALFITKTAWNKVGGFPEQPLMEDVEICKQLKILVKPICLKGKATTSARRWEKKGIYRTVLLMWRLRWLYWRGVSAEKLAEYY